MIVSDRHRSRGRAVSRHGDPGPRRNTDPIGEATRRGLDVLRRAGHPDPVAGVVDAWCEALDGSYSVPVRVRKPGAPEPTPELAATFAAVVFALDLDVGNPSVRAAVELRAVAPLE